MSTGKAPVAWQIGPPQPPAKPKTRIIGTRHVPGTVVRRPDLGIYYEVSPVDPGRQADMLQKALLQQYTPKQVVMVRGLAEDLLVRQVEMIDRVYFGFAGLFGVQR